MQCQGPSDRQGGPLGRGEGRRDQGRLCGHSLGPLVGTPFFLGLYTLAGHSFDVHLQGQETALGRREDAQGRHPTMCRVLAPVPHSAAAALGSQACTTFRAVSSGLATGAPVIVLCPLPTGHVGSHSSESVAAVILTLFTPYSAPP